MLSYRRDSITPADLRTNQGIVENIIDDHYYVREFQPQAMQIGGSAARGVIGVSNIQWPCVTMPDAASSTVNGACIRPNYWLNGKLQLRLHYTSTTAGTATFNLDVRIWVVYELGNLIAPAAPNILFATPAVAGPSVAQNELEYATYTTGNVTQQARRIGWRVMRDGAADTNNNPLNITHLVLTYVPVVGR